MIIEGLTQSEWYCNVMSKSWVYRGDILSAHQSMNNALDELLKALFALNNELLPARKWRIYLSRRLEWLPCGFREKLEQTMTVKAITIRELQTRRDALNHLWKQMLPRAEKEVAMKFSQFKKLV